MKKTIITIVLLVSTLGVAYADFTITDWQYFRNITPPPNIVSGTYTRTTIDRETNASSANGLSDLRIISAQGVEVPYQLVVESEATRSAYVTSALRDLSSQGGNTMFILDLGTNRSVHDHLVIMTESKNFKRPVTVYASDENLTHADPKWRRLGGSNNYIYNFYDQVLGFNAGKGDVYYPENTSRYLRVVIGVGEGGDVVAPNARVLRTLSRDANLSQMSERAEIVQNSKEQTTEITTDLGASGIPSRSVMLHLKETKNFNRRVVVQGSNDKLAWSALGHGYVFWLDTPLFKGSNLSIPYRETMHRFVRVVIFNQDDQPIQFTDEVMLSGVTRSLVFEVESGGSYALYVGNKNADAPKYDIAHFFEYIETTALPPSTLSLLTPNPSYAAPKDPDAPFVEKNKNVLNAVLVLLVAMITFMLIAYLKKLKMRKQGE